MSSGIINTIQEVSIEAIDKQALHVLFGKVQSVTPLVVKVGSKLTLTEEFIVLDSPVDVGEDVVVIQYSNSNKYLVLSTVEKVYKNETHIGGIVNSGYSTNGQWKSLGIFKVTHYCCEKYPHICNAGPPYKTATGTIPHKGGCAVDPKKIPLGSYVKLNGVVYHAEDTGGAIKGNRIDLVVDTHKEALRLGTYNTEVFLKVGD